MALMNNIQSYPMQFLQPMFPPALNGNPEIAKAAMYGGGGAQPGVSGGAAPAAGGAAPAAGGAAPAAGGGSSSSGLISSIMKILGGSGGSGDEAIMSFLAGL